MYSYTLFVLTHFPNVVTYDDPRDMTEFAILYFETEKSLEIVSYSEYSHIKPVKKVGISHYYA